MGNDSIFNKHMAMDANKIKYLILLFQKIGV